jgi:hypothetical protein
MSKQSIVEEINNAVGAHGVWKLKLKTAISTGSSGNDVEKVKCDNLCDFGQWLYSDKITADLKQGKPYEVIKRLHAEFHEIAASVLIQVDKNESDKAKVILETDFAEKSSTLVRALSKWKAELSK